MIILSLTLCNIRFADAFFSDAKAALDMATEAKNLLELGSMGDLLDILDSTEDLIKEVDEDFDSGEPSENIQEVRQLLSESGASARDVESIMDDLTRDENSIAKRLKQLQRLLKSSKKIYAFVSRLKEDKKQTFLQKQMVELQNAQLLAQLQTANHSKTQDIMLLKERLKFKTQIRKDLVQNLEAHLKNRASNSSNQSLFVSGLKSRFTSENLQSIALLVGLFVLGTAAALTVSGIYYQAGLVLLKFAVGYLVVVMALPEIIQLFKGVQG